MKKYYSILMALIIALGCGLTSCSDDETGLSRMVLASVSVLEYEALPTGPQIITVTSDADWVAEAPEWITVSPTTGSAGQTEVEISVSDNYRDGGIDNPRKSNVLFKGRNLESIATVIISQKGDKYRDPADYTIASLSDTSNETIVKVPSITLLTITQSGFIGTDGTDNILVKVADDALEVAPFNVGEKYDVVGSKLTDDVKFIYVDGGKITSAGQGTIISQNAIDITESLDKVAAANYGLVTVTGNYDDITNSVSVKGQTNSAYLVDVPSTVSTDDLNGHKITLTGYYAGTATPVVRVIPTAIEDLGLNETVYFFDDFEWLDPWAEAAGASDYVALSETIAAESINIDKTSDDGTKLIDVIMVDHGYGFVKATGDRPNKTYEDRPFEKRIYLQRNYLKFGLTGIEAGLILPSVNDIPDGEKVELLFDWTPMRQGSAGASGRKYDDVELVVIVENNGTETQVKVPNHTLVAGGPHEWMRAVIDLSAFTINANTKITIRSCDEKWPNYKYAADDPNDDGTCAVNRWFIDNIKIRAAQ